MILMSLGMKRRVPLASSCTCLRPGLMRLGEKSQFTFKPIFINWRGKIATEETVVNYF